MCYNIGMQKKKFSIILLVIIYTILVLDLLAFRFFFYWKFWWFDIVMHFLGGFWVAMLGYYILYLSDYKERFKNIIQKYSYLTTSLIFVLSIGILWELFEAGLGSYLKQGYLSDTILDLIMDMSGWLVAYIYIQYIQKGCEKNIS